MLAGSGEGVEERAKVEEKRRRTVRMHTTYLGKNLGVPPGSLGRKSLRNGMCARHPIQGILTIF